MKLIRVVVALSFLILAGNGYFYPRNAQATVAEQTGRNDYTGNGATVAFSYGFKIFVSTEIEVLLDGVVQSSGYTVTGLGGASGGTVTFTTAPASGVKVTFLRKQSTSQTSDYIPNEAFPSERVEKDLDKQAMIDQMQNEQLTRSLHMNKQSGQVNTELSPTSCGDKALVYNAAATGFSCASTAASGTLSNPVTPEQGGVGMANTTGYTKVGLPAAGTAGRIARVTDDVRGLWLDQGSQWFPISGGVVNVKERGAKCDGVTNDSVALQAAIDALPNGGIILIPQGADCFYTTSLKLTVGGTILTGTGGSRLTAGVSFAGSILRYGGSGDAICVAPASASQQSFGVRDLTIRSSGATGFGVAVGKVCGGTQYASNVELRNLTIRGFDSINKGAINVQNVSTFINNVYSELNYFGITDIGSTRSTTTFVKNFYSNGDLKNGVYLEQTQNFALRDSIIESVGEEAVRTYKKSTTTAGILGNITIDNLWTESTNLTGGTFAAVFSGDNASHTTNDVIIRGGQWETALVKGVQLDFVNKAYLDNVGFRGSSDNVTVTANAVRITILLSRLSGVGAVNDNSGNAVILSFHSGANTGSLGLNNVSPSYGKLDMVGAGRQRLFQDTNDFGIVNNGSVGIANGVEWDSGIKVGVGQGFFMGGETNSDVVQFKVSGTTVTLVSTLEGLVEASSTPTASRYGIYVSGGTIRIKHNFATGIRFFAISWFGRIN